MSTTPTTPVALVTVDHTSYPHLVDLIFNYAPRDSLLVMRQVSRQWWQRSDGILARHLIYRVRDGHQLEITAPQGLLPCFDGYFHLFTGTWTSRDSSKSGPAASDKRFSAAFKGTRIVEVAYHLFYDSWGEERFYSGKLQVVKFVGRDSFFPQGYLLGSRQATGVIGFTEVISCPHFSISVEGGSLQHSQPHGARRFVLNIEVGVMLLDDRARVICIPEAYEATPSLQEAVIIFHGSTESTASLAGVDHLRPLQMISKAFNVGLSRPIHYTVVGSESISRSRLGSSDDLSDDQLQASILAAVNDYARSQAKTMRRRGMSDTEFAHECDTVVNRLVNAVEVLTHDEYKSLVGQEQYLFETTSVPSDGGLDCRASVGSVLYG